jgi:hypothetical protein
MQCGPTPKPAQMPTRIVAVNQCRPDYNEPHRRTATHLLQTHLGQSLGLRIGISRSRYRQGRSRSIATGGICLDTTDKHETLHPRSAGASRKCDAGIQIHLTVSRGIRMLMCDCGKVKHHVNALEPQISNVAPKVAGLPADRQLRT